MKRAIKSFKKSQSTLEYAMIIACVAAALLSMQIYIKRAMQGRLRKASDDIGEQYAPVNVESDLTITLDSRTTIDSELVPLVDDKGIPCKDPYGLPIYGIKTTVNLGHEITEKFGKEELGEFEKNLF